MHLFEINRDPTKRQLRQFGVCCLFVLPAVGWLWSMNSTAIGILTLIGLSAGTAGITAPRWLRPVFITTTLVAMPIGYLAGELAMLLIYFGLFLPIGIIFRVIGRDALFLKPDRTKATYWKPRSSPKSAESYYRQS